MINELGKTVIFMGWGNTGSNLDEPFGTIKDNQFRVATNVVYELEDDIFELKFDDPVNSINKSLETEGLP